MSAPHLRAAAAHAAARALVELPAAELAVLSQQVRELLRHQLAQAINAVVDRHEPDSQVRYLALQRRNPLLVGRCVVLAAHDSPKFLE